MRALLVVGWLMVPLAVAIWHYGPGQDRVQLDQVAAILAVADEHALAADWSEAVFHYDQALRVLPADRQAEARRVRLERAKAQMNARQLPEAHADLQTLVAELKADKTAEANVLAGARTALANAQYYLTWLLRLEGAPRELWEPEIEAARQTYRLLAEEADQQGDGSSSEQTSADQKRADLESAIRLARMDLSELQGLSLPSQCRGCCSGKCAGKNPGISKQPLAKRDGRGANLGPPPDGSGH